MKRKADRYRQAAPLYQVGHKELLLEVFSPVLEFFPSGTPSGGYGLLWRSLSSGTVATRRGRPYLGVSRTCRELGAFANPKSRGEKSSAIRDKSVR
ncbi:hypothetical protein NDU88_003540 [Pleurodeles waltl]|uniref:Uncharacterized protein n=1 Tax=Pleurodeles waltl TaxID=8319 RepID=A0AAV7V0C6_PLEWA|nr:hypothetical protein NDU88_003540 [Pleurodeles waltl]